MEVTETADGTNYTGQDAVDKFKQLQAASGNSDAQQQDNSSGDNKDNTPDEPSDLGQFGANSNSDNPNNSVGNTQNGDKQNVEATDGDGGGKKKKGNGGGGDRNPKQDKPLTPGDINELEKRNLWNHRDKGDGGGKKDLYKDQDGNVYEKGKGNKGPGEPLGINLKNLLPLPNLSTPPAGGLITPSTAVKVGTGIAVGYILYKLAVAAATWECLGCGVLFTP